MGLVAKAIFAKIFLSNEKAINNITLTIENQFRVAFIFNFSNEFNVKSIEQKKISGRFSSHKVSVYAILDDESKENYRLKEAIQIFKIDNQYKNCIEEIINAVSIHGDTGRLSRLLSSYLHMYINRFFVSCQRKNELIIYNYLFRYYDSKLAKEKNKIDESSIIGL